MPAERLSMRKIKEVLRLKYTCQLSQEAIAASCGIGRTSVREYLRRAEAACLGWPLPADMSDRELERKLFPPPPSIPGDQRPGQDCVENGVLGIERRVLAPLRNRTFFSLGELNQAIRGLLTEYNNRPFQKLPGSRRSMFESLERPALKPLPDQPYEYAQWKKATVNIDYHIELERHYYSVPYQLVRQKVDVRY